MKGDPKSNHFRRAIARWPTSRGVMRRATAIDAAVPKACLHHVDGVLDILLACIAWEGAPIEESKRQVRGE